MILTHPRYDAREMGPTSLSGDQRVLGIFDTFAQTWVAGKGDTSNG